MYNQQNIVHDSTYGSLSGFLSSNSSYTMSLSESEFPEEPPSTSGCSSDFPNSSHKKEKKKEKVKQYLKQLKQMVAPETESGTQLSTVGALKHVLDNMQKSKDEPPGKTDEKESQQCTSSCSPVSITSDMSESEEDMNFLSLKSQDDLQVLVSAKGLKIIQISPNLKKILGYPMDSWAGRELTSFLHRKDVVTVNSSLATDGYDRYENHSLKYDDESATEASKKVIYCRFKHYKALRKGFNLDKRDQYTSFQVTVTKTSSRPKHETSIERQKQYLLLECRPLMSAYHNWSDLPQEKKVFSTRHSLFCSYTYVHPNAIQLLGFLPQDMVGMSIFDFYHPEDFEQLYNIYKEVVNSKGTTIKSPQIRFHTYNGDWIYAKTEWSSFVDPWSNRIEFILGKHTVVKGPKDKDVFSPPLTQESIAEDPEQYHKNLRMIRKLLLQPVVDEAKSVALNIIEDDQEDVSVSPTPDQDSKENGDNTDSSKKISGQSGSGDLNKMIDNNLSGTYEQLNYTNNIKRFLLSQPKSYSSASDKRSCSLTDDSNAIDSDEVPDFEVDIPLPKPPSFCSSTKVLVSEKEDMVPSPSCQTEEIGEETAQEAQNTSGQASEPHNVVMSLTQETLQEHTKQQEKIYLQQAKQDKNLVLLNMTSKYSVMQESSHGVKRVHSPDTEELQNIKSFKVEEKADRHQTVPLLTPVAKQGDETPKLTIADLYRLAPSTIYTGGMPVVQLIPNNIQLQSPVVTSMSSSGMNSDNMQWPFYPHFGLSFYPQVMDGFYQPVTVCPYPSSGLVLPTTDPKYNKHSQAQGIFTQAGTKCQTSMSISDSSSQENTSSSYMYLFEITKNSEGEMSSNRKKPTYPSFGRLNERPVDPPWLFGVLWNESVQMRYTLPKRKFNRVMKEDRDALNIMKQGDLLLLQMEQIKEDIEKANEEPTVDEEADYLFQIEPNIFKDDSSNDSQDLTTEELNDKFPTTKVSDIADDTSSKSSSSNKLETFSGDVSGGMDSSSSLNEQLDDQEKKSDSECDSGQKSDCSVDKESMYSKSSDLTPSDARSTDEKGSSMKESDTQSSKLSEGNKDSESENDLNQTKNTPLENSGDNNFDIFFVKNPTRFKHSKHGFWLNEADLNEKVQKEYRLKTIQSSDILLQDYNRLKDMNQSSLVQEQLAVLLEDLTQTNSSQKDACLCETMESSSSSNKCQRCISKEWKNKSNDSFYDSLFMQPLFTDDIFSSNHPISDSPDIEDLCDVIGPVD